MPIAGIAAIVHGGDKRSRSSVRRIAGIAWKPRNGQKTNKSASYINILFQPGTAGGCGVVEKNGESKIRTDISPEINAHSRRYHQLLINRDQAPVQHRNQHLERRATHAETILQPEQARVERDVRQQARGKRRRRQRQPDDGEELEMPAVRGADVVLRPVQQVRVRAAEAG